MSISIDHLTKVCRLGLGPLTCAYLIHGEDGFVCAKDHEYWLKVTEKMIEQGKMKEKGDNCPGWNLQS